MLPSPRILCKSETERRNGPGTGTVVFVSIFKHCILMMCAWAVWNYIGGGAQPRFHGVLIGVLAGALAIQEAMYVSARGKMNEAIKSTAIGIRELDQVHSRIVGLKDYAEGLWKWTLPMKFGALLIGVTLYAGGSSADLIVIHGFHLTGDFALAVGGWYLVFIGMERTLRTVRVWNYIDGQVTNLDVEARKLAVAKAAAVEVRADQSRWENDETLNAYPRLK